nr:DEAD/H associated [uncultured bacterium]
MRDSLTDAMDVEGLENLLKAIESGAVQTVARDLTQPSPLALEVLSARPYAYLDDAPLEERRTQAVLARRWISPEQASDLGRLDQEAIERVRSETWPEAENADELQDALVSIGFLTDAEIDSQPRWRDWLDELAGANRAGRMEIEDVSLWISAERAAQFRALWPSAKFEPQILLSSRDWSSEDALLEIVRGRLEGLGPVTSTALASPLGLKSEQVEAALARLEAEDSPWADDSAPTLLTKNGANGDFYPASIAIRLSGSARRSSQWLRATFCVFCSLGSALRPKHEWPGRKRWTPS